MTWRPHPLGWLWVWRLLCLWPRKGLQWKASLPSQIRRRTVPRLGTGTGPPQVSCCSPNQCAPLWPQDKVLHCFPSWLRKLAFASSSGTYLEWMVPYELGKRRVNTPFTPSSDFHHYHLAIKFITIDPMPAISKTLFWILWERYIEEWTLPKKRFIP